MYVDPVHRCIVSHVAWPARNARSVCPLAVVHAHAWDELLARSCFALMPPGVGVTVGVLMPGVCCICERARWLPSITRNPFLHAHPLIVRPAWGFLPTTCAEGLCRVWLVLLPAWGLLPTTCATDLCRTWLVLHSAWGFAPTTRVEGPCRVWLALRPEWRLVPTNRVQGRSWVWPVLELVRSLVSTTCARSRRPG